ncbi:conserved hypothetical protein [Xenorhabdus bovienii str. puntauvense]|uniref:HEAT repeat domain-containing protein n=1 Tax=Xenorhabdus bovienii str. puntauvense TaxID=1398201 RepID=A0A077N8R5_XENBV|nr:HEAT repeat domain-containing protein [Xenorhabdus bovienii]CDG95454.1 conserved hypothetical protein [Xenorhabdus bovienii str. puntauvense]
MLDKKIELIISFVKRKIDQETLVQEYIENFDEINICYELELSMLEENSDAIEYFLYFGALLKYEYTCIHILNILILMQWHNSHEDLARLLQRYKDPSSVDALYQVSNFELEYLDFDDSYALAVKCIWGLGDIGTPEALEKLKILSTSDNEIIKENAINQLKRRSK